MSGPIRPPLRVREQDGSPNVRPVNTIKVSNGTLTDDGNAVVSIQTGSGGGGTMDDFDITGDTGTAQTISNGQTVTIAGGTALSSVASATDTITLNLDDTAVTAGSYTYTSLTVDAQGRITAASSGTAPAVDGSGAATQVTYWSDADTITGSNNLTFDGTNLDVAGYVKSGTGVYDTDGATDLTLQTNGGTNSGTITIRDGAAQDIEITPNGAGVINLDGLKWPTADGTANQVLATDGAGTLSFTDASGGVSFPLQGSDGSSSAPTYSFSSDTDTGMYLAGSSNLAICSGGTNYVYFGSLGSVQFERKALFNAATAAAPNGFATDTNTGFFLPSADNIGFSTGGTERFRFGSSGELLVGGTAAGTSGQVLTSGGSGAAVSWTDASGGGGLTTPEFQATDSADLPSELLGAAGPYSYVGDAHTSGQWANGLVRYRPHIMQQAGTLQKARAWLAAAPSGGTSQDFTWAIWNANTSGGPGTLKATATATIATTDSGGIIEASWAAESGENLTITLGEVVWIGFYSTYGATSTAASFYFIDSSNLAAITRKDNNSTGSTNAIMRYYPSAAGSPSSVGDNPTLSNADGDTNKAWPFMWYTAS